MDSIPILLSEFPEGDDDTYAWSTRLCKGANQFLLDIMAEWQLFNKSQTLKLAVSFMYTYLQDILDSEDSELNERMRVIFAFREAQRLAVERKAVIEELNSAMVLIKEAGHPAIKEQLEESAKAYAALHRLPWPPPEIPLIDYDAEARYILDRIMVASKNVGSERITNRDLLQTCHWPADDIKPVLSRLAENGYIDLEEETRSGPPTLWIIIPTMPVAQFRNEQQVKQSQKPKPFDIDKVGKGDPF